MLYERFDAVPLLQLFFVCVSVISYVAFVWSLVAPRHSFFGASEGFCFMIVAFPGYLNIYLYVLKCFEEYGSCYNKW